MSLLDGMNTLFENKAAMEAASDEAIFEEMLALEADELIDKVVDGKGPFEDEVSQMVEEDEANEQLNRELDEEDNSIASASAMEARGFREIRETRDREKILDKKKLSEGFKNIKPEKMSYDEAVDILQSLYKNMEVENEKSKASEATALTGDAFLSSLMKDTDDPITTKPGSIGQQTSAASFAGNYSDAGEDNNDPIKTEPGSIGSEDSAATHSKNFSDESEDNNDPIKTEPGTIGQDNSTAKDPIMESAMFFGELMGTEEAMEGLISEMAPAEERSRMEQDVATLGIDPIDCTKVDSLIEAKKYDEAKEVCESWMNDIQHTIENTVDEAKESAAQRLLTSTSSLSVAIEAQKIIDEGIAMGNDPEIATESAIKKLSAKRDQMKQNGTIDMATESVINIALNWFAANESDLSDPEATTDGSVGQDNSKAHSGDNFSDGKLDSNDPVKTKDGAEGQEDSAATFDGNHSGGSLDSNDPIHTDDGSVGQKDSTAKDPAAEGTTSLSALEELEALTKMMDDEFANGGEE